MSLCYGLKLEIGSCRNAYDRFVVFVEITAILQPFNVKQRLMIADRSRALSYELMDNVRFTRVLWQTNLPYRLVPSPLF